MVFQDLIKFYKLSRMTYLAGDLKKPFYYYLLFCICVIGGMYIYLYSYGVIGLAVLLSLMAGYQTPMTSPPITVLHSIGIVLIMRYTFMSGLDKLAQKTPENIELRLKNLEDKINELHKLAFSEVGGLETTKVVNNEKK